MIVYISQDSCKFPITMYDTECGDCPVEKELFIHLLFGSLEYHSFYNLNDGKMKLMNKDATDFHVWGTMTIHVYICVGAHARCLDIGSVQFRQLRLTLCDPMNHSTPGLPVG